MCYFLNQRVGSHPSTEFLLSLTTKMFFLCFQYYLQLQGSAMQSPVAPNDANLFMGKFELDFIYIYN